jgi:dsDNA-specific endonuclease/ATPase MutS2
VEKLKDQVAQLNKELELQKALNARREEQIGGERGLSATISSSHKELKDLLTASNAELKDRLAQSNKELKELLAASSSETKGMKRAMYWVAGLIVAGSIGMAFGALQLVGGA